jgi:hypothetical protein
VGDSETLYVHNIREPWNAHLLATCWFLVIQRHGLMLDNRG